MASFRGDTRETIPPETGYRCALILKEKCGYYILILKRVNCAGLSEKRNNSSRGWKNIHVAHGDKRKKEKIPLST